MDKICWMMDLHVIFPRNIVAHIFCRRKKERFILAKNYIFKQWTKFDGKEG